MKNHKPRWAKPLIDWVERELTAVMAVAIVLAFIFSQSLAIDGDTANGLVATSTGSAITTQADSTTLSEDGNQLLFGSVIDGTNSNTTVWSGGEPVNIGNGLLLLESATVTTLVNSGTYNLKVTAKGGTIKINSTTYVFTNSYGSQTEPVTLPSNQMTVSIEPNTTIYSIEAVPSGDNTSDGPSTILPLTSISVLPSNKNIIIGSTGKIVFAPVVYVRDSLGKMVNNVPMTWTSSNSNVASVNEDGVVTPKAPGTVTITAQVTGTTLAAATSVNVLRAVTTPTVDITPTASNEDATTNLVENFVNNLIGDNSETSSTDGTDNQTLLDRLFGNKDNASVATDSNPEQKIPYPGADESAVYPDAKEMLDAFAKQQARNYTDTGSTQVTQTQISQMVQKQPTTVARVAARIRLGVVEVVQTLREIVLGRTIEVDGQTIEKSSAWKIIGNFIKSKTAGTSADTMGASFGGTDEPIE